MTPKFRKNVIRSNDPVPTKRVILLVFVSFYIIFCYMAIYWYKIYLCKLQINICEKSGSKLVFLNRGSVGILQGFRKIWKSI
jgi:hypothetical protein